MKNLNLKIKSSGLLILTSLFLGINAQNQPTFNSDPKPNGKKWVKVDELSDEFNDNSLDTDKWRTTSSGGWIGRPPGLFETANVWEANNNLRIKARRLPNPQTIDGQYFDHGGGYVESNYPANPRFSDPSGPGLYFECKMWANKTFMSSTFWLNNKRNEDPNTCQKRTTELDIHESVGQLTGTNFIAQRGWDRIMHSNAHSRSTSCEETPTGSSPVWSPIGRNVSEGYHIYGAWWKSPREIICYLDGKEVHTIVPKADFNLKLYLRLVVETYDWNPEPANDIMDFTLEERTTLYDWVRTWKLEDAPSTPVNTGTQYYLINRASGKKVRVRDTNDGSLLQQVPADWNGGYTKWTMDERDSGYFHLKNVGSGMYFRPTDDADGSTLEQRPTSWSGGYTQWTKVDTDNGWFYLQNRATGMYFRPLDSNDYVNIIQRPTTWGGAYTQWKLEPINGTGSKNLATVVEEAESSFAFYPNPATDVVNLDATNASYNVSIYNLTGAMVKSITVDQDSSLELSIGNLNAGIYIINYESNNGVSKTEKLVIK